METFLGAHLNGTDQVFKCHVFTSTFRCLVSDEHDHDHSSDDKTQNDESFRDKVKALEHAKKAAELSKEKNAEILDTLAKAYFINGQIKDAIDTENKALKLEPYNDEFKGRLKEYEKAINPSL